MTWRYEFFDGFDWTYTMPTAILNAQKIPKSQAHGRPIVQEFATLVAHKTFVRIMSISGID